MMLKIIFSNRYFYSKLGMEHKTKKNHIHNVTVRPIHFT